MDETPFNHVITPQTLQPADPARVGQSERVIHDRKRHEQQKRLAVIHFQWELATRSGRRLGGSEQRSSSLQSDEESWH